MTKKSKKILITTEQHEIFIIRNGHHQAIHGFCPGCQQEVELLNLDTAVTFAQQPTRELFELIERGAVHAIETTTGHLLVCQNSLLNGKP